MKRTYGLLLTIVLTAETAANAQEANPCVKTYMGQLSALNVSRKDELSFSSLYNLACNRRNREFSAGFDPQTAALISSDAALSSFVGGLGLKSKSNSEFCKVYEEKNLFKLDASDLSYVPLSAAQQNFNECMEIFMRSTVHIKHSIDPRSVTVFFDLKDNVPFWIEGVRAKNLRCEIPGGGFFGGGLLLSENSRHRLREDTSLYCIRNSDAVEDGRHFATEYIAIGTSAGPYNIAWRDETILGPDSKEEFAAANAVLKARADRAERRLANLRLTQHKYYSGDGAPLSFRQTHPIFGTFFPTNSDEWHRNHAEWDKRVNAEICPDAELVSDANNYQASGGCCGINFYVRACVEIPD